MLELLKELQTIQRQDAARIAELERRVTELEARLAAVEERLALPDWLEAEAWIEEGIPGD